MARHRFGISVRGMVGFIAGTVVSFGVWQIWASEQQVNGSQKGIDSSQQMAKKLLAQKEGLPDSLRFVLRWHAKEAGQDMLAQYAKLDKAARRDPYTSMAYAQFLAPRGDRSRAMKELKVLQRTYPHSAQVLYVIGMLHIRGGGRLDEGLVYLQQAMKVDPFHAPSALALATYGRKDRLLELARRVLAIEEPGSQAAEKALALIEKIVSPPNVSRVKHAVITLGQTAASGKNEEDAIGIRDKIVQKHMTIIKGVREDAEFLTADQERALKVLAAYRAPEAASEIVRIITVKSPVKSPVKQPLLFRMELTVEPDDESACLR